MIYFATFHFEFLFSTWDEKLRSLEASLKFHQDMTVGNPLDCPFWAAIDKSSQPYSDLDKLTPFFMIITCTTAPLEDLSTSADIAYQDNLAGRLWRKILCQEILFFKFVELGGT